MANDPRVKNDLYQKIKSHFFGSVVMPNYPNLFKKDFDWENVLKVREGNRILSITLSGQDGEKIFKAPCTLNHAFASSSAYLLNVHARWKKGIATLECSVDVIADEQEK